MSAVTDLRLVDPDGALVEPERSYQKLLDENEGLKNRTSTLAGTITELKRELAEVRGIEPHAKLVTQVLEFYRDISGRKVAIDSASQRFAKTRARLRQKCDPPFTVERLKTALVGAPKAEWFREKTERQDPVVVFNTAENVEKCERAAGKPDRPVQQVSNLSPLEAASQTLAREFGLDVVRHDGDEVWSICPLHPDHRHHMVMRIRENSDRGSLNFACVLGCDPDDIYQALRALYGLQAARQPGEELAALRVQVHDLERTLRQYALPKWWEPGKDGRSVLDRDRGTAARLVLGMESAEAVA